MSRRTVRKKPVRRAHKRRTTPKPQTPRPPRTLRQFRAMSPDHQERWTQALNTIAKMRTEKWTLNRAARAVGIDAKAVKQLAGSALRKDKRNRTVPTKRDSLLRVLTIPGRKGTREVVVRDSHAASQLAIYADAVRKYIRRGDPSLLARFRKVVVKDANGRRIRLVTNLTQLNELGHAGVLSFESLYARSGS